MVEQSPIGVSCCTQECRNYQILKCNVLKLEFLRYSATAYTSSSHILPSTVRLLYSYSLTLCSYYKERQILTPRPYILPSGRLGQQGLSNHRCQTPRISRAFLPRRVQWNSLMESFPTQGRTRLGRKARFTNTHRCKLLHYSAEILILIRYTSKYGNCSTGGRCWLGKQTC